MATARDEDTGIVISGMSGRFPGANNLNEFWENLISGKDAISEAHNRYNSTALGLPQRIGLVGDFDKFDAEFFGVHEKQAVSMDPAMRKTLEVTYEAILDSGTNATLLQGSRTGVFFAGTVCESGAIWGRVATTPNGYYLLGTQNSMLAGRISFAFGFTGPSYTIDTACSSGPVALHQALFSIRYGLCDAAIVAGCHTIFDSYFPSWFHHLNMTSSDGKCKAFDAAADGYARAEACVALYICRKSEAKRSYACVLHAAINNDGYKENGISYPSQIGQEEVMRRVYREVGINPLAVNYIEAHGTGTKIGDPIEMAAIANVYCHGRDTPLLVGSVKSNMGHAEPVAGLCGIVKVLLSHVNGLIPPNLHYNSPNPNIPGLLDGRIKVVDKPTPFDSNYVGVNSAGFSGTNAHILLKMCPKPTQICEQKLAQSFPAKIIMCSGRTEQAVEYFLLNVANQPNNQEFLALAHNIFATDVPRHNFRGYVTIVESRDSKPHVEILHRKEAVWYIFTGVGCQWNRMSRDLIKFATFKKSVDKSILLLANSGFDLCKVLDSHDPSIFTDVRNVYVSITVIQIALVDLLESIEVKPNGIIGHSAGEVAASYADGCLTQEQSLHVSLGRALALINSNLSPGALAVVGLSWEQAKERCPPGVYPTIHNSKENVTIAGHPDVLNSFVQELEHEGIFAKAVRSAGFGFHSPLVAGAEKLMTKLLQEVIPNPKPRSPKWLSSSVPEDSWNSSLAKYCSADYHVFNAMNPVYLYTTLLHIPESSVIIEVAPHCLLQTILKQVLPANAVLLGLSHCKSLDNCEYFLDSLGKCYIAGVTMNIRALYDPIDFPVSAATPNISSLVRWKHDESWDVPKPTQEISRQTGFKHTIDLQTEDSSFLEGHTLDDKVVFPATGYLWLAWKYFSISQGLNFKETSVVIENIRFEKMTHLTINKPTDFLVRFFPTSGCFQINEFEEICCSGKIRLANADINKEFINADDLQSIDIDQEHMKREDFYKEFRFRGYGHSGQFEGVSKADLDGKWAQIEWKGHWISFLDTIMHAFGHRNIGRDLLVPVRLEKIMLDPALTRTELQQNGNLLTVRSSDSLKTINCIGVEIRGLSSTKFNRRKDEIKPTINEQIFVPLSYDGYSSLSRYSSIEICLQIVLENCFAPKFVVTELLTNGQSHLAQIQNQCRLNSKVFEIRIVNQRNKKLITDELIDGVTVIEQDNIFKLTPSNLLHVDTWDESSNYESLVESGFILYEGENTARLNETFLNVFTRKYKAENHKDVYVILARKQIITKWKKIFVSLDEPDFNWVADAQTALADSADLDRIYFFSTSPVSGIVGFIKCLIKERIPEKIRCFHLETSRKSSQELWQSSQMSKDLIFNIFKANCWGVYSNITIGSLRAEERTSSTHAYVDALNIGDLSSLTWIESPLKHCSTELIDIAYAALNFKDVMLATGRLNQSAFYNLADKQCVLGFEFSGTINGRRVMGTGNNECLATHVNPNGCTLYDVPERLTLEEAATIPVAYTTAYYALICRGQMSYNDTVLIHSGSGAVGQAAIHLALQMGCRVFTTVSSDAKRDFVKSRFPQLTDKNIADSNEAKYFERHVLEKTKGRGVRLVLNSLADDKLQASIRCLGQNGRFLEIGQHDIFLNTNIGMNVLAKGVSIIGIYSDHLNTEGYEKESETVSKLMREGLATGTIRPVTFTVFQNHQLEEAFRSMAQRNHIGKVIVKIKHENGLPTGVIPKTTFDSKKSYIIVGGLGGMGFELANWMISKGARNLVFTSRSGNTTAYHENRFRLWQKGGVRIKIHKSDLSIPENTLKLLEYVNKLGPIGGIFNVAVVLNDAGFENQSPQTFEEVAKCKVHTTMNLDLYSRSLAPSLDHFVVFSSITSARGVPGQTNYGYANSVMERICENRAAQGLPALAIQWGAVGDVGVFHRQHQNKKFSLPISQQGIVSCLETLDTMLQQRRPVVSSFVPLNISKAASTQKSKQLKDLVASILGIRDVSKIDKKATLVELGMDSLMSAEVAQVIGARAQRQLSKSDIAKITFEILMNFDEGLGTNGIFLNRNSDAGNQTTNFIGNKVQNSLIRMNPSVSLKGNIFMIHPIDGTMFLLENLMKQLNANAYGLVCSTLTPVDSIKEQAEFYIKEIKKVQKRGPYMIGGYSYGTLVAIEMALQLEQQDERMSLLLLLDGGPLLKNVIMKDEYVNKLLTSALFHYWPKVPAGAFENLKTYSALTEKLSHIADIICHYYPLEFQDQIRNQLKKISAMSENLRHYTCDGKIKGKTILIRSLLAKLATVEIQDYGLGRICVGELEVMDVEGDHMCFFSKCQQLNIPDIINNIIS